MSGLDDIIKELSQKLRFHLSQPYSSNEDRQHHENELRELYQEVSRFPVQELTASVWDEMNDLAEQAQITLPNY